MINTILFAVSFAGLILLLAVLLIALYLIALAIADSI